MLCLPCCRLELLRGQTAAGGDEAAGCAAEEFQAVGEEIGERFRATASEGNIDQSSYHANEDTVQDEAGSETAADPDGEEEASKE